MRLSFGNKFLNKIFKIRDQLLEQKFDNYL